MYNNESFDDYIRQVLGYPNNEYSYTPQQYDNYSYPNHSNITDNNVVNMINEDELESCYPEIYKVVYPMIKKRCSQINEKVTEEIASTIEPTDINDIQVNINLQNELNENRIKTSDVYKNTAISETSKSLNSQTNNLRQAQEKQKNENRGSKSDGEKRFIRNNLADLIKILIIRELLNRPGGRLPRPSIPGSRPPFPGHRPPFPGERPPMGPPPMPRGYFRYDDIYEM